VRLHLQGKQHSRADAEGRPEPDVSPVAEPARKERHERGHLDRKAHLSLAGLPEVPHGQKEGHRNDSHCKRPGGPELSGHEGRRGPEKRDDGKGPRPRKELSLLVDPVPIRVFPLEAHEEPQDERYPKSIEERQAVGLHGQSSARKERARGICALRRG